MDPELPRRAEEFWIDLSREQYRALAGLEPHPRLAEIYSRYADLFQDDVLAELAGASPPATPRGSESPARATESDEERRCRHLREFLLTSRAEMAVGKVMEERLAWEAAKELVIDSERVPYRQASAAMAATEDAQRRWRIERARLEALREIERVDRERFQREWDAYAGAVGGDYVGGWRQLNAIDLEALAGDAAEMLEVTEHLYRDLLTYELPRRLGLKPGEARAADRMRLERAPWFDAHFAVAEPLALAQRQLGELGLELEAEGRVRLDLEMRPAKWARAFCAPIRVPQEVFLVISPTGGWRDWFAFFHELGHAQHFGRVDPALPFEDRVLGDASVTEAYARLFERLTTDPVWLERYLALKGEACREFVRLATLVDLVHLRRQAGKLLYELELHGGRDFAGMPSRYAEIVTTATALRHDPAAYLDDVDPRFYCARYLRAWALHSVLVQALRDAFDEDWFRNPRAAPFLLELFAVGLRDDADTVARRVSGKPLSFERVITYLEDTIA